MLCNAFRSYIRYSVGVVTQVYQFTNLSISREMEKSEPPSVLAGYQDLLDKTKSTFSFNRDLMDKWTSSKITLLAIHMSKPEWYKYLIECGFIIPNFVTCNQCNGKMSLQSHGSVVDGVRFICKNKLSKGSVLVKSTSDSTRSVRYNTWF